MTKIKYFKNINTSCDPYGDQNLIQGYIMEFLRYFGLADHLLEEMIGSYGQRTELFPKLVKHRSRYLLIHTDLIKSEFCSALFMECMYKEYKIFAQEIAASAGGGTNHIGHMLKAIAIHVNTPTWIVDEIFDRNWILRSDIIRDGKLSEQMLANLSSYGHYDDYDLVGHKGTTAYQLLLIYYRNKNNTMICEKLCEHSNTTLLHIHIFKQDATLRKALLRNKALQSDVIEYIYKHSNNDKTIEKYVFWHNNTPIQVLRQIYAKYNGNRGYRYRNPRKVLLKDRVDNVTNLYYLRNMIINNSDFSRLHIKYDSQILGTSLIDLLPYKTVRSVFKHYKSETKKLSSYTGNHQYQVLKYLKNNQKIIGKIYSKRVFIKHLKNCAFSKLRSMGYQSYEIEKVMKAHAKYIEK